MMIEDPHLLFNKKAVVIFNLGGPSSLDGIEPFLFNLFYDKCIIRLPNPFRFLLAKFISKTRLKKATKIYSMIGGKSPILDITIQQANKLQNELSKNTFIDGVNIEHRVFVCMRYTAPDISHIMTEIADYHPNEVILLPLYPQYSTTTTGSFFLEWDRLSIKRDLYYTCKKINEYHTNQLYIDSVIEKVESSVAQIKKTHPDKQFRVLFSAHGIPESIIKDGDPYEAQTIETVRKIVEKTKNIDDWVLCYQSKVGKLKWLEPSTEQEISRAGSDRIGILIVPISFTSDHSETLVEIDIDYKELSKEEGVPFFFRSESLNCSDLFIKSLHKIITEL